MTHSTRLLSHLLALALIFAATACTADPQDSHLPDAFGSVLILEDDGSEAGFLSVLERAGADVDLGGSYRAFDGEDLGQYDVVIFLNGVDWRGNMDQEAQNSLRDWVADGGALLTTEWLMWSGSANETITDILPVTYGGSWASSGETYERVTDHPIADGLPREFSTPSSWSYSTTELDPDPAKEAVVIFAGSRSGDAVTAGRHEDGRVVHWNMGGAYSGANIWNRDTERLLVNIINYLADD